MALEDAGGRSDLIRPSPVLGETPSIIPDIPINAVFLVLFLLFGASHGYIFVRNLRNGRKFVPNVLVAVFCFTRLIATSLRMAWACHSTDHNLAIAANIFLYAGVILLYLINLVFSQRILRAQHPHFGWSKSMSIAFIIVFAITAATVIAQITSVITGLFSTDPSSVSATKSVQKYGATMMAFIASLPLFIVTASCLARKHPYIRMTKTTDKFGEGSMRGKVITVLTSSTLLSLSAWFRAGVLLADEGDPQPGIRPGYLSKACFYVFIFMIEILVVALWLAAHIDKRFYIPDRAHGPFSYAGGFVFAGEIGNEKTRVSGLPKPHPPDHRQSIDGSIRSTSVRRQSRRASSIHPSLSSPTSQVHRPASWAPSMHSVYSAHSVLSTVSAAERRAARLEALDRRVSWGGISREDVRDHTDEAGKVVRYAPFAESWTGGDRARDVGVEGVEREMGFDPETGVWVVRAVGDTEDDEEDGEFA